MRKRKSFPDSSSSVRARSPPMPEKRKRLSLEQKQNVVDYVRAGNNQVSAALHFEVSRTAVVKMMQDAPAIAQALAGDVSKRTSKLICTRTKLTFVEDMLHRWHAQLETNAAVTNPTGETVRRKAIEFAKMVLESHGDRLESDVRKALVEFKASNGWLDNYLERHRTYGLRRDVEREPVAPDTAEARLIQIRSELQDVPLCDIWNVGETSLRYGAISPNPYVTTTPNSSSSSSVKRCKEWITVASVISATGEKMMLRVTGRSKNSPSLKDLDVEKAFEIKYETRTKSWNDNTSMLHLYRQASHLASARQTTFYLLVADRAAHVTAAKILDPLGSQDTSFRFENIVIFFSPSIDATTGQPLDHGILRSVKANFRIRQLRTLLDEYELWNIGRPAGSDETFPVHDHAHLRNCFLWLKEAYENVSEDEIRRCFVKVIGLPYAVEVERDGDINRSSSATDRSMDLDELLSRIRLNVSLPKDLGLDGTCTAEELLKIDEDEAGGSTELDENEIVTEVLQGAGDVIVEDAVDGSPEFNVQPISSVIEAAETVRCHLQLSGGNYENKPLVRRMIDDLMHLQKMLTHERRKEREKKMTQPTFSQFMKRNRKNPAE